MAFFPLSEPESNRQDLQGRQDTLTLFNPEVGMNVPGLFPAFSASFRAVNREPSWRTKVVPLVPGVQKEFPILPRSHPSIDDQLAACDICGLIRGEVEDAPGDVLGLGQPPEQRETCPLLADARLGMEVASH